MAELTDTQAECQAKMGMLVLRDCGQAAVAACDTCGRPVCGAHQTPVAAGIACPECAAQDEGVAEAGPVKRARRRSRWYRSYGYRPYYYHHYGPGYHHHYYSDHDYRTFDDTGPAGAAAVAAAASAADDIDGATDAADDVSETDFDGYDES